MFLTAVLPSIITFCIEKFIDRNNLYPGFSLNRRLLYTELKKVCLTKCLLYCFYTA